MKEVEILFEVLDDVSTAQKSLAKFESHGPKKTLDVYYVDPLRKELQPTNTNTLNSVFRLREKDGHCFLAYKVNHYTGDNIWTYSDEHEVEVSDLRTTENIIEHLGLTTLVEIDNIKHTYTTDRFEIVLEEVKNLGTFLEVERLQVDDTEDIETAKKEIREFVRTIGIQVGEELNIGKPELMLKKVKNSCC
jgi:adenylate cyclase class 2